MPLPGGDVRAAWGFSPSLLRKIFKNPNRLKTSSHLTGLGEEGGDEAHFGLKCCSTMIMSKPEAELMEDDDNGSDSLFLLAANDSSINRNASSGDLVVTSFAEGNMDFMLFEKSEAIFSYG